LSAGHKPRVLDQSELLIDKDDVPIRYLGPDTVQILDSFDTESADEIVELPKTTGSTADAWKEMLTITS
jgi:hypothetical protein